MGLAQAEEWLPIGVHLLISRPEEHVMLQGKGKSKMQKGVKWLIRRP